MKKLSVFLCTAFAAIGFAAPAGAAGIDLYNAHEFNLDIFGTRAFTSSDSDRLFREDANGGGLGLSYFMTEYLGVGVEGALFETDGDTLGSTAINALLRLPLGDSGVAVHGLGGVGFIFNPDDLSEDHGDSESTLFEGHLGVGAEWRFNETFGVFADWRYTFSERDRSDFSQARLGMRFAW